MTKRFQKELDLYKPKNDIKFTPGVLICMLFSVCILIVSSFTVIHITHYYIPFGTIFHSNTPTTINNFIAHFDYVPQVPAVAIMTVILGRKYSSISIILYLLIGIFLYPVFSLGGGLSYIFQYGFGYFIGFFPMVFILGKFIKEDLKPKHVFLGTIFSILVLHLVGSLYVILICAIRHEPFNYVQDLLYMMTYVKIIYDIIITLVCVYLANITKKFLWLAMA